MGRVGTYEEQMAVFKTSCQPCQQDDHGRCLRNPPHGVPCACEETDSCGIALFHKGGRA